MSGDKLNPGLGKCAQQWVSMATPAIVAFYVHVDPVCASTPGNAADEGNASSWGA